MISYKFTSKQSGHVFDQPLWLVWEADYSSYPYDEDMKGREAWTAWRKKVDGPIVPIYWFVAGEGTFEGAPFIKRHGEDDFLDFFTWPEDAKGDRLRWTDLPVKDGKSVWIREYIGWRPAPFTLEMPVAVLEQAAMI